MTSITTNSSNSEPIYCGGDLPEFVKICKKNNKDMEVFPQKTNFSGDKNGNGYVDLSDLNEDEVKLFEEKGIIGKSWDYIREYFGKIFGIKSTSIAISDNLGLNGETRNITLNIDDNGDVISSKEVWSYSEWLSDKIEKKENIKYDEHGNTVSYERRLTNPLNRDLPLELQSQKERVSEVQINNIYNDKNELIQRCITDGRLAVQETYNYDENIKIVKKGSIDDATGNFKPTTPEYKGDIVPLEIK